MPGIFDPQITQGTSGRGESFVRQPVEAVSGQALNNVAEAGANLYGVVQANKAAREIGRIQGQFLDDLSANRRDLAEIDSIRQQDIAAIDDPTQQAVLDSATGRIKTLQDAIASRRINPTEAMSRIEAEKRRAISQAPMFAREINNLTGPRGETFDTETDQMIKEINALREGVAKIGGNPDVPSHVTAFQEFQATNARAQLLASQGKIEGIEGGRAMTAAVNAQVALQEQIIMSEIENAGGFDQLDPSQTSDLIARLQPFVGGGEVGVVKNLIDGMPGVDYNLILQSSPKTIENMETQVRSAADTLIRQLNGEIPKGVSENRLAVAQDQALLNLQQANPGLFNMVMVMSKLPSGALATETTNEILANDLMLFGRSAGLGEASRLGKNSLLNQGVTDPVKTQKLAAENIKDVVEFIKTNSDTVGTDFSIGAFDTMTSIMKGMSQDPKEFTPKMFDELSFAASSPEVLDHLRKLDPVRFDQFRADAGTMIRRYTTEAIVPDINNQMNKRVFLQTWGAAKSPQLKDLISASISLEGSLIFSPKSGLQHQEDEVKVAQEADRLNRMYSGRSLSTLRAINNISERSDLGKDVMVELYQQPMTDIGVPLTESPGSVEIPSEQDRKGIQIPLLSRDR